MSDPQKAHELAAGHREDIGDNDIVFDCPECHKNLAVDLIAAGHELDCPSCGKKIMVPQKNRVVTLAEAPETADLLAKPQWEQSLMSVESAIKETDHQRQEAGNFYKHHFSEANRQKMRIDKLDAKLKELHSRRNALQKEHP